MSATVGVVLDHLAFFVLFTFVRTVVRKNDYSVQIALVAV